MATRTGENKNCKKEIALVGTGMFKSRTEAAFTGQLVQDNL